MKRPTDFVGKIRQSPIVHLRKFTSYFDSYENLRIANIYGSCGKKAMALAALGAEVTVFDLSEDNQKQTWRVGMIWETGGMRMHLGFSYMGLTFLLMLMVPNMLWTRNMPKDYDKYVINENKLLLIMERIGEVLVSCFALIFSDFNPQGLSVWGLWLLVAGVLMLLYEIYWVRYFRSEKTMKDFYSSLLGIPVAGATMPVLAFLCLGIYGRNPFLVLAVVVLGIGHIGIHLCHRQEILK